MKVTNAILMNAVAQPITTRKGDAGYIVNGQIVNGEEIIDVSFFAQPVVVDAMDKKVCLVDYNSEEQYPTRFKGMALNTVKSYAV
jgi:predicted metalloenzyme YecM